MKKKLIHIINCTKNVYHEPKTTNIKQFSKLWVDQPFIVETQYYKSSSVYSRRIELFVEREDNRILLNEITTTKTF